MSTRHTITNEQLSATPHAKAIRVLPTGKPPTDAGRPSAAAACWIVGMISLIILVCSEPSALSAGSDEADSSGVNWSAVRLARQSRSTEVDSTGVNWKAVRSARGNGTRSDFDEGGLAWHVWTNFMVKSYGRDDSLYSSRRLPEDWVGGTAYSGDGVPALTWSKSGLLQRFANHTALSQVNTFCGHAGQMPVTLLSRRHGYMRGHQTLHDSQENRWTVRTDLAGHKVWFCDQNDNLVAATVQASFGGTGQVPGSAKTADFVVLLFEDDVPSTIANMQVCFAELYYEEVKTHSWDNPSERTKRINRATLIATSQHNKVGVYPWPTRPGFAQDCYVGGDSGSPHMLPVGDSLVMFEGATTTGFYGRPEPHFQADTFVEYAVEVLNEWAGIDSRNTAYNLEYADLSAFGLTNGSTGNLTAGGVPVLWLEQYNLSTTGSDDDLDADSDGVSNQQEWRDGTDPTDPDSVLKLWTPVYSPAGVLLRWNSEANRTYWVERADALSDPMQWTVVHAEISGQPNQTTFLDPEGLPGGRAFYRVGCDSSDLESPIRMELPEPVTAKVTLRWDSVANKVYTLERASSPAGPFAVIQNNIVAQSEITSFVDTNSVAERPYYYRILVQ